MSTNFLLYFGCRHRPFIQSLKPCCEQDIPSQNFHIQNLQTITCSKKNEKIHWNQESRIQLDYPY